MSEKERVYSVCKRVLQLLWNKRIERIYSPKCIVYQRAGKSVIYERKWIARQYALSGHDLIWRPQEAELRSRNQGLKIRRVSTTASTTMLLKKSPLDERTKRGKQLQYLKWSDTRLQVSGTPRSCHSWNVWIICTFHTSNTTHSTHVLLLVYYYMDASRQKPLFRI